MRIIGINNEMYISSACLIADGKISGAAAEERFTRDKLSRAFPKNAIAYCLKEAGIQMTDVDFIALSWNPSVYFSKFNPLFSGQRRHLVEQMYSVPDNLMHFYNRPLPDYVYQEVGSGNLKSRIYYITHHRTHAANGFFLSPFDSAAILTADAQGEFESTTFSHGQGNKIKFISGINYPHSLGVLYSAFTEYLGFYPNSDEWKVMAMASYAKPENRFYKLMKEHIVRFPAEDNFELDLSFFKGFIHEQPDSFSEKMTRVFGPPRQRGEELTDRHFEIAAALQQLFQDAAVYLLKALYDKTKEKNLVLSGGCFMNSVFNGRALELTPFENIFISSCPDDSGNCFGAALYLYNHILGKGRIGAMRHNYYGPDYSNDEIRSILSNYNLHFEYKEDMPKFAAGLLAEGKIIGWFQGRMEFGQRALGNRSILADPRDPGMKDAINGAVKYRENFRPFAPAVLKERQQEYFETGASGGASFMERVHAVRPEKRKVIPAVVHVDGSGRLQTVEKDTNPKFYALINEFERITGVPVVLNTSFNLNNEPIVCSPKDAIRTFYSSGLDVLILGDYAVVKEDRGARQ